MLHIKAGLSVYISTEWLSYNDVENREEDLLTNY